MLVFYSGYGFLQKDIQPTNYDAIKNEPPPSFLRYPRILRYLALYLGDTLFSRFNKYIEADFNDRYHTNDYDGLQNGEFHGYYSGVFELSPANEREYFYSQNTEILILYFTPHVDAPYNMKKEWIDENRVLAITNHNFRLVPITINTKTKFYENDEGNKLTIIGDDLNEQTQIATSQPAHISSELSILNKAAYEFWKNAAPEDKETHPKNAEVEEWLIKEGLPKTYAPQAATIIRPDWATKGRR